MNATKEELLEALEGLLPYVERCLRHLARMTGEEMATLSRAQEVVARVRQRDPDTNDD